MRAVVLAALAAPALAFMPAPVCRAPTALKAAHVQAGGDYYPGKVDYGDSTISITETLKQLGRFNTLLKALDVAGLTSVLGDKEKIFTMYAPNDAAFAKIPEADLNALLADPAKLGDVLKYHVVPLVVKDKEGIRAFRLSNKVTVQGGRVRINVRANPEGGEQLVIFNNGEANIGESDIDAINGTIHEIDGVLAPRECGTRAPAPAMRTQPACVLTWSTVPKAGTPHHCCTSRTGPKPRRSLHALQAPTPIFQGLYLEQSLTSPVPSCAVCVLFANHRGWYRGECVCGFWNWVCMGCVGWLVDLHRGAQ